MRRALAITLAILARGSAFGQTPAAPPRPTVLPETITVSGTGIATVAPDRVSFTAGVETTAPTLPPALEETSARMRAVMAALKTAGADEKEIRTAHVSVSPQMDYAQGRRPRIVGYEVTNSITVTRSEVKDVGRLLQAAIDAGANQVSGLAFTVADPARGREGALAGAFADARAKAEVLARAAGRTLGRAVTITEGPLPEGPPRPLMLRMGEAAAAEVPVAPGLEEVRFTVSVMFELR